MQDQATGPRTPMRFRSKIRYGGGPSGQETVKSSKTISGKAPNVKKFESQGMCCAGYVSYYYLNYLPNVVGAYDGCAYSVAYRFDLPQSEYDYDVSLKTKKVKYDGKAQKPEVVALDAIGKVIDPKNYTVYYSNNKKIGTAKAKVIFKGKYKGTKTLKFNIVK